MARGLNVLFGAGPRRGRRAAWALLVLGVVGVHGCVTQGVADRMADLGAEAAMPPRMEVAYVREMALAAPAPTAAPAAPPALAEAAAVAPRVRKPKPPKPPKAASAPEPRPEPAEVVAAAASEPAASAAPAAPMAAEPLVAAAAEPASAASAAASGAGTALAAATPASAASGSAPGGKPFEWPASTRMSYSLTGNYRGEVSGSAQVEWIRSGSNYQVHVDFVIGPSFAPVITNRSTSNGEITAEGLAPRRYDQDIRLLTSTRPRQTIVFEPDAVVLANGERRDRLPGLQDTASQFVQLTYVFSTRPEMLRVGGSVDIPLALPKKVAMWTYDVVAEETLQTAFGPLTGIHLKPRTNDQKAGTLSVEMWMAPQLRYLPVRIRFEQDAQTYVDLIISKPPEIAH